MAKHENTSFPKCLVRWGRKMEYHSTAHFLSNISVKNYQNLLMYIKLTASHRWDESNTY